MNSGLGNITGREFKSIELKKALRKLSVETLKLISWGSSQRGQPSIKEALQPIGHCHLQWVIVSVPHRRWCGSQGHPCVEMNAGCLTWLLWLWWEGPSSDTTTPILHAANKRLWAETNACVSVPVFHVLCHHFHHNYIQRTGTFCNDLKVL